jgi:hypothetical protein
VTNESYCGYINRETWAAALWLSNDEALYNAARDTIAATPNDSHHQDDAIEDLVTEICEEYPNIAKDIGSLWRIHWPEVAASLRDD